MSYMDVTQAATAPAALAGAGLSTFATDSDQHWVYETGDGHIWQIVYTYATRSFGYMDLTQAATAPAALAGSGLSTFATASDQHWVFETSDGHIRQIVYTYATHSFGNLDVTEAASALALAGVYCAAQ
jgi:hypothetical protein